MRTNRSIAIFNRIVRLLLPIILIFQFLPYKSNITAQTFQMQGRTYEKINGIWYNFWDGELGDQIIPHTLIVRLPDKASVNEFEFSSIGLNNIFVASNELAGGYYIIKVEDQSDPFVTASIISNSGFFDYVEFDALGEILDVPNDPLYNYQWGPPKISLPSAWDITTGANDIILAIIDSGIDYKHEDLANKIWNNLGEDYDSDGHTLEWNGSTWVLDPGDINGVDDDNNGRIDDLIGWDFWDYLNGGDKDPFPTPVQGQPGENPHGTAVAGIAAAQTNNGLGIAGVAGGWGSNTGVKLMNLRYYWKNDPPTAAASSSALCLQYAYENGADVINMSFAWRAPYTYMETACSTAANGYDCVLVAGSGNSGGEYSNDKSVRYPAKYDWVIAVGATDHNDSRWVDPDPNSAYGSCFGPELDLMAPGGESTIYTTDIAGPEGDNTYDENYLNNFGGTSASAPVVAGVAALIRSIDPGSEKYFA